MFHFVQVSTQRTVFITTGQKVKSLIQFKSELDNEAKLKSSAVITSPFKGNAK